MWHGSNQSVALLRHYWVFSSSVLLDRLFLIFLLKISHRFHMGFRSGMMAGQSNTVISWSANHLEVVLSLWAGAKFLREKEISISIKLVSRWKHKVLQNLQVDGCINFGLDKTKWTNTSRRHPKIITDFGNFTLNFKELAFCASPVFLQTPDLDFQMKCKIYFHLKRGLWTTEQQSSSFSPQPR